jgi:hypothetical protein
MDKKEKLKIRWDNAPHWESVSTFPHHKHVESVKNILLSPSVVFFLMGTPRRGASWFKNYSK